MSDRDYIENLRKYAEGRLNSENTTAFRRPLSPFVRMIVLEVISDPNNDLLDEKRKAYWQGLGTTNMTYASKLPRNTIIARRVGEDSSAMFVFPFFPSHLSLPCKPGECVWVMFENPDSPSDAAFWICRVIEPHTSDDVNHSHPGRDFEISMTPSTKDRADNESSGTAASGENVWHELRNGPVVKVEKDRTTSNQNILLKGETEDVFERLITETDASKLMSYESVPRFRKRPGDIALEGTNNTLIVLGTDRAGPIATYEEPTTEEEKLFWSKKAKFPTTDYPQAAGSIDIVVGRGQTDLTSGKEAETTSIKNAAGETKGTKLKNELNKSLDVLLNTEGDPDFVNDRSRILVSQRTSVDTNFNLSGYNADLGVTDNTTGDAAIVIKSDKVRLVARSDLQILVTNFTTSNTPGRQDVKLDGTNAENWASITIKTNGDIVFKPSAEGYVRLGDETADRAILCTDSPATIDNGKVSVSTKSITTTMGGAFGGTGQETQGTWAKKVLVTGAK